MIAVSNCKHEKLAGKYLVHVVQVLANKSCKTSETMKLLPVTTETETVHVFKVEVIFKYKKCTKKKKKVNFDRITR